ncbi:nucleotidyltransferase [Bacillus niameyensis]|uniref:nucleotidyltransferase n=1 Tax=Bacillus niameyensis TaxID=1522308 RepID=UPI0007847C94|nr:nucleotidyltransferase [Bacillus niameyensis]
MDSVGIVAEYNPFHNGHQYQLQMAKKITDSDIVIAIMSGNFLQRGEPALVSKWARTKMALQLGVDLVIELPYAFTIQKAEIFAFGAVFILNAMKCKKICFGSESGDITTFYQTYDFIENHKDDYEDFIRSFIKTGMSYPKALSEAFKKLNPKHDTIDLSKPNNILGFYYISAASVINPSIKLYTVKRKNANYHDTFFNQSNIASATSIRMAIQQNKSLEAINAFIPSQTFQELHNYKKEFSQYHTWEHYWPFLQYKLLSMNDKELEAIYEVEEGLENRLLKAARTSENFTTFMQQIKTKRYTWTRLQRVCVHILNNTQKQTIQMIRQTPEYIRLLGMTNNGREYLRKIKKDLPITLISKISSQDNDMLSLDIKATDIYAHALKEPFRSKLRALEFEQPPIIYP